MEIRSIARRKKRPASDWKVLPRKREAISFTRTGEAICRR
jgi:hypothetical protein